jgi:hypothetical protein
MVWLFRTPTVLEGPAGFDRLFRRVQIDRGISIQVLPQGTYRALRFPTQDEIADAFFFYMGGHEYLVDSNERTALISAGVGVTTANFTDLGDNPEVPPPDPDPDPDPGPGGPGTYGDGLYGAGPYGG